MKTSTISVVFGTRPEAIKLAPVVQALRNETSVRCSVCVSAQHREMLDEVLDVFSIVPDADLDLMKPDQSLSDLTARAMRSLDQYLKQVSPDLVLIQGDTTTTLCTALAAFYNRVPIGHVEAGLRTFDLDAPWPEEGNRVLTSRLANLHFAPTDLNRGNLTREGVDSSSVIVVGNTVIDALMQVVAKADGLENSRPSDGDQSQQPVVLITAHRRESFGQPLRQVCSAVARLATEFDDLRFVFSLHPNPNVREIVRETLSRFPGKNLNLVEPLGYVDFVKLMASARLILTDSGGIQEEAPSLGIPVLLLRECTERPEGVQAGATRIVGTDEELIVAAARELLPGGPAYQRMARVRNPYGDGRAGRRIVQACKEFLLKEGGE